MSESDSPRKSTDVSSLRGAEPKRKPRTKKRSKSVDKPLPFLEADEFSDVTIVVGDKRLYSNKCLLCYNSPVLSQQLTGDGGKGKGSKGSKDLDLSERKYDDVCELLAFIDPRIDTDLTDDDACRLLPMAEEFEIKSLLKACNFTVTEAFLKMRRGRRPGNIGTDVTIKNLIIADRYKFKDLEEMCIDELAASDNSYTTKQVTGNKDISDTMKTKVLQRVLEHMNLKLAKAQKKNAEQDQSQSGGAKIWRK